MIDDRFISLLKKGDEDSFKRVIVMYQKRVLKIAYGYVNSIHDADDITQDVFITLFHNLNKIVDGEHLKLLIYRIAVSKSLDFVRKERIKGLFKRKGSLSDTIIDNIPDEKDNAESDIIRAEFNLKLTDALNTLSDKQKTVFVLKHHEGLTIKEVARIASLSESTVKTHFFRAVKALKKIMSGENDER